MRLSTGVAAASSLSDSWLGVAAPLSLDTHSSSSPSEGLAIVKPTRCLDVVPFVLPRGVDARRKAAGLAGSLE